jgi:hypothetical protein
MVAVPDRPVRCDRGGRPLVVPGLLLHVVVRHVGPPVPDGPFARRTEHPLPLGQGQHVVVPEGHGPFPGLVVVVIVADSLMEGCIALQVEVMADVVA